MYISGIEVELCHNKSHEALIIMITVIRLRFLSISTAYVTIRRRLIPYCHFLQQEPSLYTVKAVLILDNDGDRLYAKV